MGFNVEFSLCPVCLYPAPRTDSINVFSMISFNSMCAVIDFAVVLKRLVNHGGILLYSHCRVRDLGAHYPVSYIDMFFSSFLNNIFLLPPSTIHFSVIMQ